MDTVSPKFAEKVGDYLESSVQLRHDVGRVGRVRLEADLLKGMADEKSIHTR